MSICLQKLGFPFLFPLFPTLQSPLPHTEYHLQDSKLKASSWETWCNSHLWGNGAALRNRPEVSGTKDIPCFWASCPQPLMFIQQIQSVSVCHSVKCYSPWRKEIKGFTAGRFGVGVARKCICLYYATCCFCFCCEVGIVGSCCYCCKVHHCSWDLVCRKPAQLAC